MTQERIYPIQPPQKVEPVIMAEEPDDELVEENDLAGQPDDLEDIVSVSNEDIMGDDVPPPPEAEITLQDELDMFDVSFEDAMGYSPNRKERQVKRVKRYPTPPQVGGVNY